MSLRVWLPLTKDLRNQGLDDVTVTNNGAAFDASGKLGGCYLFDGSNDYLTGTYKAGPEVSFSAWVNLPTLPGGRHIFDARTSNGTGYQPMYLNNNSIQIGCSGSSFSSFNYTWVANTWYHICVTHNATEGKCYINGILIGTSTVAKGVECGTCNFTLGSRCNQSNYSNVKLNDIRIYDHTLSPLEVKHISQGLILHYPLNRKGLGPTNLLKNGFGELGIENWSYAAGMFSDVPENHPEIYHSYKNVESKEFIPIYRNHNYKFSTWIKTIASSGNSYPSICPYDADKLFIATNNCKEGFDLKTMTVLTRELKAGDTKIYVEDLSKWNTNSGHYYDTAAIFSYKDGTGYTWPDGIYTRNCPAFSSGTEAKTNLDKTNNIITLLTAYNGVTIPIGTKVCASTYGNTYFYPCGGIPYSTITNWTFKENTFSSETPRLSAAKYIRVLAYSNCYQAGITVTDLTMESFNNNIEYDCSGFCNNGTRVGTFSWTSDTPKYQVSTKIAASASGIKLTNFSIGNIWSMSVWFKYPSQDNTGWKALVVLNNNGSDSDLQLGSYINCSDGRIQYSANGKYDSTSVHFVFGEWNHLVGTYDGTILKCYLNGEYKTSLIPGQTLSNRKNLGIGFKSKAVDFSTFGASMTNGLLSDVRIYTTTLSADDVKSLYNNSAYIDNQGNIYGAVYEEI